MTKELEEKIAANKATVIEIRVNDLLPLMRQIREHADRGIRKLQDLEAYPPTMPINVDVAKLKLLLGTAEGDKSQGEPNDQAVVIDPLQSEPIVATDPEPTEDPEPAKDPEPTVEVEPAKDPEPTVEAEPAVEPVKEPETKVEPAKSPEPTKDPEPAEDPEPAVEVEPTKDPEPTTEAEPTVEPAKEPKVEDEPAKDPEPTVEVEPTKDPEPVKQPETKPKKKRPRL